MKEWLYKAILCFSRYFWYWTMKDSGYLIVDNEGHNLVQ